MRHAFSFPQQIREAVRAHVRRAINVVDPTRFRQEPDYVAALLARLSGIAYEGPDGFVEFKPPSVDSVGPNAAESWSGADLAITANIRRGEFSITKAILGQAKLGGLRDLPRREHGRLVEQIQDMRRLTRSPKVLLIRQMDGRREPEMASGVRIVEGKETTPLSLPDYFVRRVLTTLDGDTRPEFVRGVQDSSLQQLHVLATLQRQI
jgi:hypothetical protein